MKLYVAGPMTGLPEFNFPAFARAAGHLRAKGFEVVNPAELVGSSNPDDPSFLPWAECLKRDLKELLTCDGIATLSGWSHSKGARLEVHVAQQLGLRVRTVSDWLWDKTASAG